MKQLLLLCCIIPGIAASQGEMIFGNGESNQNVNNASTEAGAGEDIGGIQTRATCNLDYRTWCFYNNRYYVPCMAKSCPGSTPTAAKKFMGCNKGVCSECSIQGQSCMQHSDCCDVRVNNLDKRVEPQQRAVCLLGKCTACVTGDNECRYNKATGMGDICCPVPGKKNVQCRAVTNTGDGLCTEDPCVKGPLKKLYVPGYEIGDLQPRCNSNLAGAPSKYEYYCTKDTKSCVECLAYKAVCSKDGGEKCCDYMKCVGGRCFPKGCATFGFECRNDKSGPKCCDEFKCVIHARDSTGHCGEKSA